MLPTPTPSAVQRRRPGRKPRDDDVAEDERTRRLRESNRNFRERQRLHVAALEARVHELEAAIAATAAASTNLALSPAVGSPTDPQTLAIIAENSILRNCAISVNFSPSLAPGTPGCQTCAVEKARTLIALGQIHCLETRISELMAENHTLRTSAGHFSNAVLVSRDFQDSSGCADALMVEPSSQPMIVTTNVEVSPPALSVSVSSAMDEASLRSESSFPVNGLGSSVCISDLVESAKATLKAIPALKNCEFVEKLFDCYMQCRMLTDEDDFYDGCILFKYYRSKVIDLCTIVEQRDVMEALSEMMEKDIDVPPQDFLFREKFDLISDPVVRAEKIEKLDKERSGRVSAARAAFLSIPSLKNMDEYVDDFCITLFTKHSAGQAKEKLLRIASKNTLYQALKPEDTLQFRLLIEALRKGNRDVFDGLMAEVFS